MDERHCPQAGIIQGLMGGINGEPYGALFWAWLYEEV